MDSHLIIHNHFTQHTNDKQEVKPLLKTVQKLPPELGRITDMAADADYFSYDNVDSCYSAQTGHRFQIAGTLTAGH